jgi:hypothetical protein
MSEVSFEPQERGKSLVTLSAVATLVCGVGIAVMGLYWFRPTPSQVAPPPEPVIVEKFVEVKVPVREPAKPELPPTPPPPPPQPKVVVHIPGPWEGVWQRTDQSFPMFQLHRDGETFSGLYAPNALSGAFPFKGGGFVNGKVVFAVADQVARLHFRMEMRPNGDVTIESWMKPEDALIYVNNTIKLMKWRVRTVVDAAVLKAFIEKEVTRLGTSIPLGVFRKVNDPGITPRKEGDPGITVRKEGRGGGRKTLPK